MRIPMVVRSGRAYVLLAVAVVVGAMAVLVVRAGARDEVVQAATSSELSDRIGDFLAGQHAGQPYRDPAAAERSAGGTAFERLLSGPPGGDFAALGFTTIEDVDLVTGRRYALIASAAGDERAWGAILVDLTAPVRLGIEVPHPRTDIATEFIGLELFRAVPGSVLLIAGAHRRAAGELADVAHNADSMYQVFSVALAERAVPQVQLHGYADLNLPDANVVVSTGADRSSPLASRIAEKLREFTVCRAWERRCGRLEGTTNVQGRAAAERDAVFVHVELSNNIRVDADQRAGVVAALAAAVRD